MQTFFKLSLALLLAVSSPLRGESSGRLSYNASFTQSDPAPEASFKDGSGNKIRISDLKGKVIFMNFWATWCGPCRVEMPTINKLYDQFRDNKDIIFMSVDVDVNYKKSSNYLKKNKLDLPLYIPASNLAPVYLDRAIPNTVIINKSGEVVFSHAGATDYSNPQVVKFIRSLVKE